MSGDGRGLVLKRIHVVVVLAVVALVAIAKAFLFSDSPGMDRQERWIWGSVAASGCLVTIISIAMGKRRHK